MFMGFLDTSTAFDRLKHSTLFRKLIDRRVPNYIVTIMMYWYANKTMCVRWSGIVSQGFHVTNGVRQGGILSPYLFRASKSPDFSRDLPIFDKIMKISRYPDLEWKSPDFF